MPRIDTITLRCSDPDDQIAFYRDILGMPLGADGVLRYAPKQAGLSFSPSSAPYLPARSDVYWKIALAVPNLDLAYQQLTAQNITVSAPRQFEDVGYLAHLQDPAGFTIELIEHWFQGERPNQPLDHTLLGGGAALNLLTLRSNDMDSLAPLFENWGMVPLCVQPLAAYGFTLHFYAFTDERPPNPDLTAIENRVWTYQRPYTVLEIQHVHGAGPMTPPGTGAGYGGTRINKSARPFSHAPLGIVGCP